MSARIEANSPLVRKGAGLSKAARGGEIEGAEGPQEQRVGARLAEPLPEVPGPCGEQGSQRLRREALVAVDPGRGDRVGAVVSELRIGRPGVGVQLEDEGVGRFSVGHLVVVVGDAHPERLVVGRVRAVGVLRLDACDQRSGQHSRGDVFHGRVLVREDSPIDARPATGVVSASTRGCAWISTWLWTSPLTTAEAERLVPLIARVGYDCVELPLEDVAAVDAGARSARRVRSRHHGHGVRSVRPRTRLDQCRSAGSGGHA